MVEVQKSNSSNDTDEVLFLGFDVALGVEL